MSTDPTYPTVRATQFASLAALVAVVVGAMVLIGWAFDIAVLKSILPGWVSMKPNAAVCFILTGIALWLTARQQSAIFLARLFGLLAGLIGLLTLGEFIFGWNLGIDQWLIHEPVGTLSTAHPIRMAPEAAMNFVLLSVALWLTGGSRQTHTSLRARWSLIVSVSLSLLVMTLALAALLSHLTPGFGPYGWFGLALMAVHAAILFAMLGMAVIAINWQQQNVLQWSLSKHTTAAFACGMALLVFIGLNTSRSQFWMNETNRQIVYSEKMMGNTSNLLIEVLHTKAQARSYFITGDEQFKTHYLEVQAASNAKLDALRKLVAGNPHQQQQFARIEASANAAFQWLQQVIDARRTGMTDAARNQMVVHGEELLDNLRSTLAQIESEDRQIIEQLKRESNGVARFSYLSIFIGTLASLLIFLAVIFRLNSAMNERKQAAEELGISALNHQMLFENSHDALMTVAPPSWKFTGANQATLQLFGASSVAELTALGPLDVAPERQPDGRLSSEKVPEMIAAALREGSHFFEWEHQRLDGQPFATDVLLTRMKVGEDVFLQATVRDITERKQAENKLAKSEQHFRAVAESANDAIITAAGAGNIVGWNAAAGRVFGYTEAEIIGQPLTVLMPERFRNLHREGLARVVAGGAPHVIGKTVELAGLRKDGSEFPLEFSLAQWQADEGQFFTAVIRDITERKKAEQALIKSEALLNEMGRLAKVGGWEFSVETRDMTWTEEVYRIHELDTTYKPTVDKGIEFYAPASRPIITRVVQRAIEYGDPYDVELEFITAKGNHRWVHANGNVYREHGKTITVFGTFQDITERKQVEESIRISQARFGTIFNQAPLGIALIDSFTGKIHEVNPRFAEIAGRTLEEMTTIDWMSITHPDDVQKDLDNMALLNAGKIPGFRMDKRYLRPDGSFVWINMTIAPLMVDKNISPRHLCMIEDITERKQAETKLHEQLNELNRWQEATLGREMRTLELKREVNEVLAQAGQPPRYHSV